MIKLNHTIKAQRMELTYPDESRAGGLHAEVLALCRAEIQQAIGDVLDQFNFHGSEMHVFKKIEIDLGTIERDEVAKQMPVRVALALTRFLQDAFSSQRVCQPEKVFVRSSNIGFVKHYLRHGHLPWNAKSHDLDDLFMQAMEEAGNEVRELLRQEGFSDQVRVRLAERFSSQVLKKVIYTLEPENALSIVHYHRHLVELNIRESIVQAPRNELERALWLFVFNHLLVEQGSVFNQKSFALSLLRQFSSHYNVDFSTLLLLIHKGLQNWEGPVPVPFKNLVEELITEDIPDHSSLVPEEKSTNNNSQERRMLRVAERLSKHADNASWDSLRQEIERLDQSDVSWWLKSLKSRPKEVHAIISKSTEKLPSIIIRKLEPVEHSAIVKYHANFVKLHTANPLHHTTRREVGNVLWTFMVIHLVESHDSHFNHKFFLKSLISSFSAHYNLTELDLLTRLIASSQCLPSPPSGMNTFLTLINEIYTDMSMITPDRGAKPIRSNSGSDELIKLITSKTKSGSFLKSDDDIVSMFSSHRTAFVELRKYVSDKVLQQRIVNFKKESFAALIRNLLPPSAVRIAVQFWLLANRMETQLSSHFPGKGRYQLAVRYAILDVVSAVACLSIKNENLLDLLMRGLLKHAPKLSLSDLYKNASLYCHDPRLHLVQKAMKSPITQYDPITAMKSWITAGGISTSKNNPMRFASRMEALRFLSKNQRKNLSGFLLTFSSRDRKTFVKSLSAEETDVLLTDVFASNVEWCLKILRSWKNYLNDNIYRDTILEELKKEFLIHYALQRQPSLETLSAAWLRVLNKNSVTDSFYRLLTSWSLPRHGSMHEAIEAMEKEIATAKGKSVLKSENRETILRDAILSGKNTKPRDTKSSPPEEPEQEIYIDNAGLVLIYPYLPFLFEQCGLLTDGKFNDRKSMMRAVRMLHYAATGTEESNEESMVLCKILCGMHSTDYAEHIKLKSKERRLVNDMLLALAEHWTIINKSQPDEIRGNWLMREGRLRNREEHWELIVTRQSYDILMESLPFTISMIKHTWMDKMITVQW